MADLERLLQADGAAWRSQVDDPPAPDGHLVTFPLGKHSGRPTGASRNIWSPGRVAAVAATAVIVAGIALVASSLVSFGQHRGPEQAGVASRISAPTPASGRPLNASRVRNLSGADLKGLTSMPWRYVGLYDGGKTIVVSYTVGNPCAEAVGFVVHESSAAVELTAYSRVSSGQCEQSLVGALGAISLDKPLGNRPLIHGT